MVNKPKDFHWSGQASQFRQARQRICLEKGVSIDDGKGRNGNLTDMGSNGFISHHDSQLYYRLKQKGNCSNAFRFRPYPCDFIPRRAGLLFDSDLLSW